MMDGDGRKGHFARMEVAWKRKGIEVGGGRILIVPQSKSARWSEAQQCII